MKSIAIMLLLVIFGKSCGDEAKQDMKSAVIEYTANTRGYFLQIMLKDQKLLVRKDRSKDATATAVKMSEADKNELVEAFRELNLEEIPDLKPPTEKRFYDGAAMADLKIIYKDKTYQSQTFDHGNPPVEIERIVNKLVALATQEQ